MKLLLIAMELQSDRTTNYNHQLGVQLPLCSQFLLCRTIHIHGRYDNEDDQDNNNNNDGDDDDDDDDGDDDDDDAGGNDLNEEMLQLDDNGSYYSFPGSFSVHTEIVPGPRRM